MNTRSMMITITWLALPAIMVGQTSQISWLTFDAGYGAPASATTSVRSVIGQVIVGQSQQKNTRVESGFLANPVIVGPSTAVNEPMATLPKSFVLRQNYPNPFNPSTVIQYSLPAKAYVRLRIYNVLGQDVAELIDGEQQAGYRQVSWNASSFASGIYFYRLEATSLANSGKTFTSVLKMIYLK